MKFYFSSIFFIATLAQAAQAQSDSTKVPKDSLKTVLTDPTTSGNFLKNTSIASPTAASLGKYADVPINHNTGLPSISIPLAVVKGSQLSLPISLSYHGGGHKVAEIASWVGLGWSLNAGGVISRQVMGGLMNLGLVEIKENCPTCQLLHYDTEPDMLGVFFQFNI